MAEQVHVTLRITQETLERVDAYRNELERLNRHPVSRAIALRALLEAGLEAVKQEG